MDFRKGQWSVGDAFDLNKASDLIDDKMAKNLVGDLKRQIGPEGFPKPRLSKDGGPLYSPLDPNNKHVPTHPLHKVNSKNNLITNSNPLPPKASKLGPNIKPDMMFKSPMKPSIGMVQGGMGTPSSR